MDRPLHEHWEHEAEAWAAWARTPGHDEWHWRLNWPAFVQLLPAPGRLTLDLGCGEGRGGLALQGLGHTVVGVDAAPTMAQLARATGAYVEVHLASAADLPLGDGAVDLVVAYMSLHDMDDYDGAIRESARVLGRGGRLCAAVSHPVASAHLGSDDEIPYFEHRRYTDVIERDGLRMTYHGLHRTLQAYLDVLRPAGLSLDALREPAPTPEAIAAVPALARALRRPPFLHFSAVRA